MPLWHLRHGCDVAVYRTSMPCRPAGRFAGNLIVSMRPFLPADAIRAIQITSRFPNVHGAPVHFGDPAAIGIANIDQPDFGAPQQRGDPTVAIAAIRRRQRHHRIGQRSPIGTHHPRLALRRSRLAQRTAGSALGHTEHRLHVPYTGPAALGA